MEENLLELLLSNNQGLQGLPGMEALTGDKQIDLSGRIAGLKPTFNTDPGAIVMGEGVELPGRDSGNRQGLISERFQGMRDQMQGKMGGSGKGMGNQNDWLQMAFGTGAPIIDALVTAPRLNQLRDESRVSFDPVELKKPAVRAMRKGRFSLPSRPSTSATLEGQQAQNFARDSYAVANENQFNAQDEAFRLSQEGASDAVENQERLTNNSISMREKGMNSGYAFNELMADALPNRRSDIESAFYNTNKNLQDVGDRRGVEQTRALNYILQYPDGFDEETKALAKNMVKGQLRKSKYSG